MGNSLVFVGASSQYLSQTGKTGINQQTFTVSFWIKRVTTGAVQVIYYANDGTINNVFFLDFTAGDVFNVQNKVAGATNLRLITTATYTDTASWHHFLIAIDTTQATASSRALLYVDGVLVSSFTTATYPAQNTSLNNNYASPYFIGAQVGPASFLGAKLAQVYYIDGHALTPLSFINGTPGVPTPYSGTYTGTFDFFLPFSNSTSTTTLGADSSGEGNNWVLNNMTTSNQSADYPVTPQVITSGLASAEW